MNVLGLREEIGQGKDIIEQQGIGQGTGIEVGLEVGKAAKVGGIGKDTGTEVMKAIRGTATVGGRESETVVEVIEMEVKRVDQEGVAGDTHGHIVEVEAEVEVTRERKIAISPGLGQDHGPLKNLRGAIDHILEVPRYRLQRSQEEGRVRHRRQVKVLIMSAVVRLS